MAEPPAKPKTLKEVYLKITAREFSLRQRFYHIIHGQPVIHPDESIAIVIQAFMTICVLASTCTFVIETMPQYYDPSGPAGPFFVLEALFVSVFTFDILLRMCSATAPSHVLNLQGLLDLLSVLGFYVTLVVNEATNGGGVAILQLLRILRLTRVLRLAKLSRRGSGVVVITNTLRQSEQGLLLLIVLVTISVVLWSGTFFYAEVSFANFDDDRNQWIRSDGTVSPFQSVMDCFWFTIVTLTTIGSTSDGDVPSNFISKAVAVIVMYSGVILIAFPTMLIGANFQLVHEKFNRQKARESLGRKFRFVLYAVRFIRLWREFRKSGTANLLRASSSYNIAVAPRTRDEDVEDEGPATRKKRSNRRNVNFMFRAVDFAELDFDATHDAIASDRIDEVEIHGVPATEVMLRLIKEFSGCATVEELYESFCVDGAASVRPKQCDIAPLLCHLANGGIVELFVLSRVDDHMLALVTKRGFAATSHCGEGPPVQCIRNLHDAKKMWECTTGQPTPSIPMDWFRDWQEEQSDVPRHNRGFCHDLKHPDAKHNSIVRNSKATKEAGACAACLHCMFASMPQALRSTPSVVEFLRAQRELVCNELLRVSDEFDNSSALFIGRPADSDDDEQRAPTRVTTAQNWHVPMLNGPDSASSLGDRQRKRSLC